MGRKKDSCWDYEKSYNEALKYKSRSEFAKGCCGAYTQAYRNKWLDDYTWFIPPYSKRYIKWDYNACYNEALKYKSRNEFAKGCGSAYQTSWLNKWLDDYTWFEKQLNPHTDNIDNVYAYFFYDFNSVYIGRTIHLKERHKQHKTNNRSTVYKFAKQHKISIPDMVVLEINLSVVEGCEKEDYYVNKFREEGWSVLNKAKTGKYSGSVGSITSGKYTHNKVCELSKKYNTLSHFRKENEMAYKIALQKGWLDDFIWLKKKDNKPKIVLKISENGNVLSIYDSLSVASGDAKCGKQLLSDCCRGIKERIICGCRWQYMDNYLADWWDTQMDIAS